MRARAVIASIVIMGLPIVSPAQRTGTNPITSGTDAVVSSQGTELQVHVVFSGDHPVREIVHLQLQNASGIPVADGFSNQEGIAVFHSVRVGNYRLRVYGGSIVETTTDNISVYRNEGVAIEYVRVSPRKATDDKGTVPNGMVSTSDINIPEKARKEMDKGMEAFEKGDLSGATDRLNKAIQIYPEYARAWNNLGVVRMRAGDKAGAKTAWEHAVAADDKLAPAFLNLARIAISEKQPAQAEAYLQKAIPSDPNNPSMLILLCTAQAMNGEWTAALETAHKIHSLPDHQHYSDAHRIAAEASLQLNQPQEALAEYAMFLQESPESPHAQQVRDSVIRIQTRMQASGK